VIIDSTEVSNQRPSLAKTSSRSIHHAKAAGGSLADKDLVKRSGTVYLFSPGATLLADKGFIYKSAFFAEV